MLYNYEVRGRTLTGLYQSANQYSGMNIRAKLSVQGKTDSALTLQVKQEFPNKFQISFSFAFIYQALLCAGPWS